METLSTGKDLLFILLLKVGAAASVAAILARSAIFRKVLFTEERDYDQKLKLTLFMTPPLVIGVLLRLVGHPYRFADLTLEGSFILGLLGGRVVGLLGGLIRQVIPNKEELWNFGPFTFLSIPRWLVRVVRHGRGSWEMLPLAACLILELGRQTLGHTVPARWLFSIDAHGPWPFALLLLSTAMAVAVPIKIWNNTRVEMNLEQHQQLLLKARMDALSSQINPHFLFNTLNTVASLIRNDPDMARVVVIKLSNILRQLLRKHETFVPLREELDFIDDYLDIEVVRFGHDNLQIFKQVDEHTLEAFVPSMLLQPIVENSLRHGLAPKLEGGRIYIRTSAQDGRLAIEIEDNGIGIPEDRLPQVY